LERRGIVGRRGIVFAVVGLVVDRLLARFDLGGVARDGSDDASPERTLDQRGVDLVWQRAAGEFGERPGNERSGTERKRVNCERARISGNSYAERNRLSESP
jgi:hypothetical protein